MAASLVVSRDHSAEDVVLPPPIHWTGRLFKHRRLMHYNRLVAAVFAVNLAVLGYGLSTGGFGLEGLVNASVINFAIAIGVRQQHVINLLFWLATSVPTSWPLRIRWTLGKVYHFGGNHVGGTVAGSVWYLLFTGAVFTRRAEVSDALLVVSVLLVGLLTAIIAFSFPSLRARHHDRFERMHRFGGWTVLVLFWAQTLIVAGFDLLGSLAVWLLLAITASVALPWLRLKKVPVEIERPSDHVALVRFDYGVTPFPGSSTSISRDPLVEWHSFANVPSPDRSGYRLTISRAGDWTGHFIDDLPSHVWVKGIPTAGVGNIDKLFRRVVWVATGSGIGPTLPHLLARTAPARLVWATRDPWATYGQGLVDEILAVQPDALIWDTHADGKPDMMKLAYQAVVDFDAEAVICISNKKLTWQVVEGMERIGIPAFGAIWDS